MGGQACVLYGAAEFSRDTDFAILANPANLRLLRLALGDLNAKVIAVPPFEAKYLRKRPLLKLARPGACAIGSPA